MRWARPSPYRWADGVGYYKIQKRLERSCWSCKKGMYEKEGQ